ncbi:MAG TPA: glycosyltransferase [Acidimicrobiales bacterium]|nr:glycosyltransferase [Acidimicrobiales bacterium]
MSGLRVQAIVSGRLAASSRFRVLQHVGPLAALGIEVRVAVPRVSKYAAVPASFGRAPGAGPLLEAAMAGVKVAARVPAALRSWTAAVTWLERELLPGRRTLEPALHRPVVFDVDDAIWLLSPGHERAARAMARRAACVVAGNDFLAEWFAAAGAAVERVPTAVDTTRFVPVPHQADSFVMGWTGSGPSLRYLHAVAPALRRVLEAVPQARLVVVSDTFIDLGLPPGRVERVRWSPAVEADAVGRFDVGLMPLGPGQWARGKCAFKMLQYMACAVPSVVTPVGMNAEILATDEVGLAATTEDEWVEALLALQRDPGGAAALGKRGRALAERSFAVPVVTRRLADVMTRVR